MTKKLIDIDQVGALVSDNKIFVDNTMLLTSGARDYLQEKGVSIVRGKKPENKKPLSQIITELLQEAHGITDPEKITEIQSLVKAKLNQS